MITTILFTIGGIAAGIIAGFFLGAWARQDSFDYLEMANRCLMDELTLTQRNEERLQLAMCELKAQLEGARDVINGRTI
jgi:hypothetical protein